MIHSPNYKVDDDVKVNGEKSYYQGRQNIKQLTRSVE